MVEDIWKWLIEKNYIKIIEPYKSEEKKSQEPSANLTERCLGLKDQFEEKEKPKNITSKLEKEIVCFLNGVYNHSILKDIGEAAIKGAV